jgi:hypothetical protein
MRCGAPGARACSGRGAVATRNGSVAQHAGGHFMPPFGHGRSTPSRALTLADIRSGSAATRALLSEPEGTLPRVRHRPMVLRLEILQSAVDDLCRLGWLDGADHRVDAAVLDAVAELVERAIALRLQPY